MYLVGVNKSDNTIKQYIQDIASWYSYMANNYFAIDSLALKDVTIDHIYAWLYKLSQDGCSASTRRRKIASLRSFFAYLHMRKIIDNNIMQDIDAPKIDKTIPRYFTIEQCRQLIDNIKGRNMVRDRLIVSLLLTTGMRLSELVSINVGDIKDGYIVIKGKGGKERNVYLSDNMVKQLADYTQGCTDPNRPLFVSEIGNRISHDVVERIVKNAIGRSGLNIENKRGVAVHTLRHTFATLNYQSGNMDIRQLQEILGHSNISTTQIYTHVDSNALKTAVNRSPLDVVATI
jgi:site-specific recombinase XerD